MSLDLLKNTKSDPGQPLLKSRDPNPGQHNPRDFEHEPNSRKCQPQGFLLLTLDERRVENTKSGASRDGETLESFALVSNCVAKKARWLLNPSAPLDVEGLDVHPWVHDDVHHLKEPRSP